MYLNIENHRVKKRGTDMISNYKHTISIDNFTTWDIVFFLLFVAEYCLYHSIVDTIAVIAFIAVSLLFIINKKVYLNGVIPWISVFVLVSWLNIELGFSINASNSYEMLTSMFKDLLFLIPLSIYVKTIGIERFKNNLIAGSLASSIIQIILSLITTGSVLVRNAHGLFNANYLAVCNAIAAIIVLSKKEYRISKRISIIIFFVIFGALAGTRKAFLAMGIGLIIYFCAKYPQRLLRNTLTIVVIGIIAYLALTRIPFLYNNLGYRFVAAIDYLNGGTGDASIYMRSWYIQTGLTHFKNSPILGHGLNCFKLIPGSRGTYSHNNFVELLFSLGIVGTASFYSIHLFTLLYGIKNYFVMDKENICLGIAIIGMVLFTDYAMVGYYERCALIFIVLFYFLVKIPRTNDKEI